MPRVLAVLFLAVAAAAFIVTSFGQESRNTKVQSENGSTENLEASGESEKLTVEEALAVKKKPPQPKTSSVTEAVETDSEDRERKAVSQADRSSAKEAGKAPETTEMKDGQSAPSSPLDKDEESSSPPPQADETPFDDLGLTGENESPEQEADPNLPEERDAQDADSGVLPDLPQEGTASIRGEVYGPSGENLPGVSVSVKEIDRKTRANQQGVFTFPDLPAGELTIQFNKLGYKVGSRTVILKEGEKLEISQALEEQPVEFVDDEYQMDEVEVVGEYVEEDENKIVFDDVAGGIQLESSIGQAEFSKQNISTAADAISKISGANVVDGKRPVVRGLADRYITTNFNGGSIASTTPLRKAVELDLFPTTVIEDIRIKKIYNATLSGDFGGAAIDIISRRIPEERTFQIKLKTGVGDTWVGDDFYISQAPELSFWGEADFPDYREILGPAAGASKEERAKLWGEAVRTHDFLPEKTNQEVDLGFSLYYGDSIELGREGKLGVIYTLARDTEDSATIDGYTNLGNRGIYDFNEYERAVDWSQMLGLTWQINRSNEVRATYFKKHVGSSNSRNIYNWEDQGNFEIRKELVTSENTLGLYGPLGGTIAEVSGNFWSIEQQENSLDILQLSGRHKLFGDDLESDDGPLLTWALTHTENEITTNTSVTRRVELDFNTPEIQQLAEGAGVNAIQFGSRSEFFDSSARQTARVNFQSGRFGSSPDKPLSAEQISAVTTFEQLGQVLQAAGASEAALEAFQSQFDAKLTEVNTPAEDVDLDRPNEFAIYNGVTPNRLSSFKESYLQTEETQNMRADFTFPILFDHGQDSRLTLRTGANHETRKRSERVVEFRVDNGSYGNDPGEDILKAGEDPSEGYSDLFEETADLSDTTTVPTIEPTLEPGTNRQTARDIDARFTTTSFYGDGEYRNGGFVFRMGARHEEIERQSRLIGFDTGDGIPTQTNSADLFGASASYRFSNDFQLLAGISDTVARPVIKETLAVTQENREDGSTFRGNSDLSDTGIENFDLTLVFPEWNGITGSMTAFHKNLDGPIVYLDDEGNVSIANGDSGLIRGLELEGAADLPGPFSLDANYAFIEGDLNYRGINRPGNPPQNLVSTFPEQPRHVLNLGLGYENDESGLNINLSYNYVSEFVTTLPTTSNGAFQVKQASPKLDLVITKDFELWDSDMTFGFAVKNLLSSDDEVFNIDYETGETAGVRSSIQRDRSYNFYIKAVF